MWKHKNFINLQLCAPPPVQTITLNIYVDGITTGINVGSESSSAGTWIGEREFNHLSYTINGNTVVWSDGTILQYIGVDVLPTDTIVENRQYATRAATPQKLPTPTNVSVTGTTVQWDEVANAKSYDVLVDGEVWENVPQPSSSETWVLNYPTDTAGIITASAQFTSNGRTYSLLKTQKISGGRTWYKIYYDTTEVYSFRVGTGSGNYTNEAYRTITFATPPTGDLLTWLQANGVKQ